MSDSRNSTIGCMADRFMEDYAREFAASIRSINQDALPVLLAAVLAELRGLRADLKAHRDMITSAGMPMVTL